MPRIRTFIAVDLAAGVKHRLIALQEELARRGLSVTYSVVTVEGPPHDRSFTCAATIEGEVAGTGRGASKKAAEQVAAREALEKLAAEAG